MACIWRVLGRSFVVVLHMHGTIMRNRDRLFRWRMHRRVPVIKVVCRPSEARLQTHPDRVKSLVLRSVVHLPSANSIHLFSTEEYSHSEGGISSRFAVVALLSLRLISSVNSNSSIKMVHRTSSQKHGNDLFRGTGLSQRMHVHQG